ncbi:MAG: hypothetical protein ACOC5T_10075 [Elusimicrobiota bacterium]
MKGIVVDADDVVQKLKDISADLGQLQKRYEKATGRRTTSFLHFKSMVDEIISTDNEEAGLESFVDNLFQEIARIDDAEEEIPKNRQFKSKKFGKRYKSKGTNVEKTPEEDKYDARERKRLSFGSGLGY